MRLSNISNWGIMGSLMALAAGVGLLGCTTGAAEARVIEDSFVVDGSPLLVASIDNGSIEVVSGNADGNEIQISTTVQDPDRVEYEVFREGNTVKIEAKADEGLSLPWEESPRVNIRVSVPSEIDLELEASNGGIRVSGITGRVVAKTSNGTVSVSQVTGDVTAETSNGRLEMEDVSGRITAETSNGAIDFSGTLRSGSRNSLKTSNGSVSVSLVDTPGVELDAATSNGRVSSSLPVESTGNGGDNQLRGTIGDGGSRLEIRASNGSISIE